MWLPLSFLCCPESGRVIFALNGLMGLLLMFGRLVGQIRVHVATSGQREHSPPYLTGPLAHQPLSPLLKGKLRHKKAGGLARGSRGMVERGFT